MNVLCALLVLFADNESQEKKNFVTILRHKCSSRDTSSQLLLQAGEPTFLVGVTGPEDKAKRIDRICRMAFSVSFVTVNIVDWGFYVFTKRTL